MRSTPDYMPTKPTFIPRVKEYKLSADDIVKVKELRPTHSVQQLAKQFKCSPLAISMYAPKKGAAIKLEEKLWNKSKITRQLTKIRKFQRKALW